MRSPRPVRAFAALFAVLAAAAVRADGPEERYYVPPAEVSDELRRQAVGIATVAVAVGPEGEQELAGLDLSRTRPINGWTYEGVALRRYPVLERRGEHLRIALDPRGEATTWIGTTSHEPGLPLYPSVKELDLDRPEADAGNAPAADLFFFLDGSRRKLYEKPEEGAPFRLLAGAFGEPGYEAGLVLGRRQGPFVEIVKRDFEAPPVALGWVKLRDEQGRITVWLQSYDGC